MSLLQFDEYELDIPQRRLTESGRPLRLGARAFDILAVLASRAGKVVSNEELMEAVWPSTTVEDGAIRVHLVSLRKTLGAKSRHYIENVPGRGYTFAAPIQPTRLPADEPRQQQPSPVIDSLPRMPGKLLGRDEFVASVVSQIEGSRIVTIVGAGGIGKTSTALAIAEVLAKSYRVIFLDLASISTEQNLVPSLATRLGLSVYGSDAIPAIVAELAKRPTLLVMDNCEHVIGVAADIVEAMLDEVDDVRVLATSREPLRVSHEKVRQLSPLAMPREDEEVADVSAFPALDLFIKLASLSGDHAEFESETGIRLAADIVRRLDGIPLAIELAAARAFDMDMHSLHRSVADPISLLRRGRRTAPPRQQTLKATMDWSFELLSEPEKELLVRLGVFAGTFSSEAAYALADMSDEEKFYQAFDGLFLKSLVSATDEGGRYRLLATTKDYIGPKLAGAEYSASCHLAHARYCQERLTAAERDWTTLETVQWLRAYGSLIHDLRAALRWAFSSSGDRMLGIELSANSHVLWTQLGLMAEQMEVANRALSELEKEKDSFPTAEMKLLISFAGAMYHTKSSESDGMSIGLFRRAAQIAEELEDHPKLLRASGGITAIHTMNGEYPSAIEVVRRFEETSKGAMPNIASRMLNHNLHYIGDLDGALKHAEIAMGLAKGGVRGTLNNGASYDQRISSLSTVVKTLWIKGSLSAAMRELRSTFAEAQELNHPISTSLFLAVSGCPTALGMGDLATGTELLDVLMAQSAQNSLLRWLEWGHSYQGVVKAKTEGDADLFNRTLEASKGARFENSLVVAGELASSAVVERALDTNAGWCRAELFRLKGLLLLPKSAEDGRKWMLDGHELAEKQGAGFWELKCATSLFKHARAIDIDASRQRLAKTLGKFIGELRTPDLDEALSLV